MIGRKTAWRKIPRYYQVFCLKFWRAFVLRLWWKILSESCLAPATQQPHLFACSNLSLREDEGDLVEPHPKDVWVAWLRWLHLVSACCVTSIYWLGGHRCIGTGGGPSATAKNVKTGMTSIVASGWRVEPWNQWCQISIWYWCPFSSPHRIMTADCHRWDMGHSLWLKCKTSPPKAAN